MNTTPSSTHRDLASTQLLDVLQKENREQYRVARHYLRSSLLASGLASDQIVSERCRRRTCEWMYDICDYFQLNREVVGIAFFYVDRCFTVMFEDAGGQVPVRRREFQLVSLTGLYIAVKLHGEGRQGALAGCPSLGSPGQPDHGPPWNRLKFGVAVCASISRDQFAVPEIEECERKMLQVLDWRMNPIVPSGAVIALLLTVLPSSTMDGSLGTVVYESATYLAELSVSVPGLSLVYKPSVVAYASISYSLDTFHAKSGPSALGRLEYETLVAEASSQYFCREEVEGAKRMLQTVCTNLSELFPLPSMSPRSPISLHRIS